MHYSKRILSPAWVGAALLVTVVAGGGMLATWKRNGVKTSEEAAAATPEPMEAITTAEAKPREHQPTATSIGTVLALRSVTLRNELAGTVRRVALEPGRIVEPGTVLVALDVVVEEADLNARKAQLDLAQTTLTRLENLLERRAVSAEEVDRARAERDVARADIARARAIIERKTIRAPFRARVGLSDIHPGQYLSEGTELTTLQGVERSENVDFSVAQAVASRLRVGESVLVSLAAEGTAEAVPARIVAIDAKVDPTTRNALVRARLGGGGAAGIASPGASVRVRVPVGGAVQGVAVPVSAVRKGPGGDHVFVISPDDRGKPRAHLRPVQVGEVLGDTVLLLEGIRPGERVATSGAFKLREGVLVVPADSTARHKGGR